MYNHHFPFVFFFFAGLGRHSGLGGAVGILVLLLLRLRQLSTRQTDQGLDVEEVEGRRIGDGSEAMDAAVEGPVLGLTFLGAVVTATEESLGFAESADLGGDATVGTRRGE